MASTPERFNFKISNIYLLLLSPWRSGLKYCKKNPFPAAERSAGEVLPEKSKIHFCHKKITDQGWIIIKVANNNCKLHSANIFEISAIRSNRNSIMTQPFANVCVYPSSLQSNFFSISNSFIGTAQQLKTRQLKKKLSCVYLQSELDMKNSIFCFEPSYTYLNCLYIQTDFQYQTFLESFD